MLGSGAIIVVDDSNSDRRRRAEGREVLPPRVVRQVHAVPRGHELDREDARAHRRRRGDADGPRHHGLGPGAHHRQLPVRARRRDGDADRLDDRRSSATSSRSTSRPRARARTAAPRVRVARRHRSARCAAPDAACPPQRDDHASRSTAARSRRPRTRCSSTPPSTATSRSRSSATSRSSASRSAPAACAWSRSRASRSCRPAARRRSRTAWSSTRRPTRVKEAQEAVVEFLLINHPLDCPVCDKGGECPLQDISFGWGGGISRFIEPKRHFVKPLELSPADRDRPRALHPLLPLRALLARRSPRTTSSSCSSAARTPSSARSTATRTSRRSAATSSSCAPSAR